MAAKQKYKWDEWFGEPRTLLVRWQDYQCSQSTMAQIIRNNAWRRRLRVRITDLGNGLVIEVLGRVDEPRRKLSVGGD